MKAAIAAICALILVGAPTFADTAIAQSTTAQVTININTGGGTKSTATPRPAIKHDAIKHAAIKHAAIKHAAKTSSGGAQSKP
jgi:hypothetical protein